MGIIVKKYLKWLTISSAGLLAWYRYESNRYRKLASLPSTPNDETILGLDNVLEEIPWIPEQNYAQHIENDVLPYLQKYATHGELINTREQVLYYDHYCPEEVKSSIVLIHGFNEYKEKYREFIYYLLKSGVEVFIYDQQGHGFSKENRLQTKIHVDDFTDYIEDLEQFIQGIVLPQSHSESLSIFGHSMGGAVVTSYVQSHPATFAKVILHAPMLSINIGQQNPILLMTFLKLINVFKLSFLHIPTIEKYDPETSPIFNENSDVVKNTERARYYHKLNFVLHDRPTRGGSLGWLRTSLMHTQKITRPESIKSIQQDVLLIRAGEDFIVNKEGLFAISEYGKDVESILIPHAYHEIFSEKDDILRPYYSHILNFIKK